ncbi:MAG: peptidase [Alphaproteobacteria bacterium]|nr:peptidase [Alphaproteobacteria bacterium]
MIRSFRHKGLRLFFSAGSTRGILFAHAKRLKLILALLNVASTSGHMDAPGLRLHPLRGRYHGFWAVHVSGNWRVIFRFEEGHVHDVDYLDYH